MVMEKRPKRVRKPKRRRIVKAKHGQTVKIAADSEVNVHIIHGHGRRVWLEVVSVGVDAAPPIMQ
jgi:hypothetical protein